MPKFSVLLVVILALVGIPATVAVADDPTPIVIVDPPHPLSRGADLKIRPGDRSASFVGSNSRAPGQGIEEHITQHQRASAIIRACNVGSPRTLRLHGAGGNLNWRVKYFVGSREVTRAVVAGSYRTRRLVDGDCARIRMTAGLKPTGGDYDQSFRVVGVPRTGSRDAVTLTVHIDGVLVVP